MTVKGVLLCLFIGSSIHQKEEENVHIIVMQTSEIMHTLVELLTVTVKMINGQLIFLLTPFLLMLMKGSSCD